MASSHSPMFRKGIASIIKGEILIAPLRSYLCSPDFKGFDIKVRGLGSRKPDGWFHPSTHPSWTPMALWTYVAHPELLVMEPEDPASTLAMTIGNIWHAIVGRSLLDLGLLEATEVKVSDPETRSTGAYDGMLVEGRIWELKTMKDMILRTITSPEDYIEKYPGYYLQAQDYMRMSGITSQRVLLMSLTYPYEMREFVIDYDPIVGREIADKYRGVLQAVADNRPPMCHGCWQSKTNRCGCPAIGLCKTMLEDGK